MTKNAQRTPLHQKHMEAGARIVDFSGWDMPVQYHGIMDEHHAVRKAAGIFDISHMGEFFVRGAAAETWLDGLLTNRAADLRPGQCQYTMLLNENGGVIDDLILYRIAPEEFLLVVNAAKIDEDREWLAGRLAGDVEFEDRSADYAAMAVQGPDAPRVHEALFHGPLPERNSVVEKPMDGGRGFIAATGYTGEPGFECFVPAAAVAGIWDATLAAGVTPCGLGARDTLRLEMAYPLNGSDLTPEHSPLEAGLGWCVKLDKPAFTGRDVLLRQKAEGVPSRLAAIMLAPKSPPARAHYSVLADGAVVGETSSGALSPSLGRSIAMAYLPPEHAKPGTLLEVDIRGRKFAAEVVRKPFYRKS